MGGGMKIPRDRFMARFATFRSDKLSSGNPRRRDERASRRAGNQNHGKRRTRPDRPPKLFMLTMDPPS